MCFVSRWIAWKWSFLHTVCCVVFSVDENDDNSKIMTIISSTSSHERHGKTSCAMCYANFFFSLYFSAPFKQLTQSFRLSLRVPFSISFEESQTKARQERDERAHTTRRFVDHFPVCSLQATVTNDNSTACYSSSFNNREKIAQSWCSAKLRELKYCIKTFFCLPSVSSLTYSISSTSKGYDGTRREWVADSAELLYFKIKYSPFAASHIYPDNIQYRLG